MGDTVGETVGDTVGFVNGRIYSVGEVGEIYDALPPEERVFNFPHTKDWVEAQRDSVDPFEERNKYGQFANPRRIEINRRPNNGSGGFECIVRDLLIWVEGVSEGVDGGSEGLGHYVFQEAIPEQDLRRPGEVVYVKGVDWTKDKFDAYTGNGDPPEPSKSEEIAEPDSESSTEGDDGFELDEHGDSVRKSD